MKKYIFCICSNAKPGLSWHIMSAGVQEDSKEHNAKNKVLQLLIEQGMLYDQDPDDGTLSLTNFDIQNNLEIKEVKDEFSYLYKYGMSLCAKGILSVDTVKQIVTERLIERTGLTPEEFDSWLGY